MLERELEEAEKEFQHAADAELMVRGAGRIRFKENDDPRFLGPSSGIAITRLVMEMAKQNTDSKSIKDVVPELTAHEIKQAFEQESSKPTSKVYPIISSNPQPSLPAKHVTYRLIDVFVVKGIPLPVKFIHKRCSQHCTSLHFARMSKMFSTVLTIRARISNYEW